MARPGRSRKQNIDRVSASGRAKRNRSQKREDAMSVVKAQRVIHHGAKPETAGDQNYENALGRLYMVERAKAGDNDALAGRWFLRHEAGKTYFIHHRLYQIAACAPAGTTCALSRMIVHEEKFGDEGKRLLLEDEAARDFAAIRRFTSAVASLKDCGPDVYRAVTYLVISDGPVSRRSIPLVENGLDALVSHYRLDARAKAA